MAEDKEVRVKVIHIHTTAAYGQTFPVWIVLVNGEYRATFRYESDKDYLLERIKAQVPGKVLFEEVYRDP